MTREETLIQIEKELATANGALALRNEGMMRVCARRAAGIAIAFWLQQNRDRSWGTDAMNRLRHVQMDDSFSDDVREAAMRLTTKVTNQFQSPFPTDPIADCRKIIDHFLSKTNREKP